MFYDNFFHLLLLFSIKFKRNFFLSFLIILNCTYDRYTEVKYSLYVPSGTTKEPREVFVGEIYSTKESYFWVGILRFIKGTWAIAFGIFSLFRTQ